MRKNQGLVTSIATAILEATDALPNYPQRVINDVQHYLALVEHKKDVKALEVMGKLRLPPPKYINFLFNTEHSQNVRFSLGYSYRYGRWSLKDDEELSNDGFVLDPATKAKYVSNPLFFLTYILNNGGVLQADPYIGG